MTEHGGNPLITAAEMGETLRHALPQAVGSKSLGAARRIDHGWRQAGINAAIVKPVTATLSCVSVTIVRVGRQHMI